MANVIELGANDFLLVRVDRELDDHEAEALSGLKELLNIRAVIVLPVGMTLSSLSADEVLRAVAGA